MIPHTNDESLSRFDRSPFSETAQCLLMESRTNVLKLCQSELSLRRDDYLEFVQLCTVFLDGEVKEHLVTFRRPGALHKARWMAKLLYSIKICLFENQIQQLPTGTITTKQQVSKVRDFVIFVTHIYSSWWMTCSSVEDAPWHDLKLLHHLIMYEDVNPVISKSALKAFKRHLWYLTAEMVPLALFSSIVPLPDRRALADSLLAVKPSTPIIAPQQRFGTGFGKPVFPSDISLDTNLSDLVERDSWFTFHILKLNPDFLSEDVTDWPESAAFQDSKTNLQALNVINDSAERGVKLSSDFLAAAKSEEHYQNVLQVVEENRKQKPNLRKREHDGQE